MRTNSVAAALLCAAIGCRGSEARGVSAAGEAQARSKVVTTLAAAVDTIPIASEVDGRWALALLSDAQPAPLRAKRAAAPPTTPSSPAPAAASIDLVLAQPAEERQQKIETVSDPTRTSTKICRVVNRRS